MTSPNSDGVRPSIGARIGCVIGGLLCLSAAFAIAGLLFDFIDMSLRHGWPRFLVFAAFPIIGIAAILVLGLGAVLITYGISVSEDASPPPPVSEEKP